MEPFFDGGLIELFIASLFAFVLNYIFLRRYLLVVYSTVVIACPVLLFFYRSGELANWLTAVCLFHAVLLVVLLWKQKSAEPHKQLFDIQKMKDEFKSKATFFYRKQKMDRKEVL